MPEGKIRVYELAKILGISSARLLTLLSDLGVEAANQMALVDASLEGRLKGLIRRPSAGGRGIAAARPEPTWLTSLKWPKGAREVTEPEPPVETAVPPLVKPIPAGLAAKAPAAPAEASGALGPAAARAGAVGPEARDADRPSALEPEEETPVARRGADTGTARGAERIGPTLPSGRTPTPPPPPLPTRRGPERPGPTTGRPVSAGGTRPSVSPGLGGGPRPPLPVGRPGATPAARAGVSGLTRPGGIPGYRPPGASPARGTGAGGGLLAERPYAARGPQPGVERRGPGPRPGPGPVRPGGYGRPGGPGRPGSAWERPAGAPPTGGATQAGRTDRRREGQRRGPAVGGRGREVGGRSWRTDDEAERRLARSRRPGRRSEKVEREPEPVRERATEVLIEGPITVRELADRMGVTGAELIKSLIRLGIVASLNQVLDPESARVAVTELGLTVHTVAREAEVEGAAGATSEEEGPEEEGLVARPPVVTVMGHVDHGKTSLLDAIRKTNVTADEAGGITQHIGASSVEWHGKRIVFLDTPGHEAFTAMRARGAQVTDVAILVVAADDGVMPQTLEAINHARAAKVPIVVALNKIDKANALPDRVKKQLSESGLTSEDWGGDTIVVPVSAKERTGIDDLLDMLLLVAEMAELKANPDRRAKGIVIETRLDKGLGPVATVLIQDGTLRVGDPILAGTAFGRVRVMVDDRGNRLEEAGPATPAEVTGLDELPAAGDILQVLADDKMAREIAAQRDLKKRELEMAGPRAAVNLADLFRQIREGERKLLNLVLKADVQGSLEALRQSFEKLEEPEIGIKIIHTGVGGVTETDVMLAAASEAIIIAFNVTPDTGARQAAEQQRVDVRTYRVIYDAINDVKAAIRGLRAPTFREVVLGHAQVRQLFKIPKVGTIAGCYVVDGKIARKSRLRVVRDGVVVHEGAIASLKHVKEDVREIAAGFECGIGIEDFQDVKEGDVLEAYAVEEVTQ